MNTEMHGKQIARVTFLDGSEIMSTDNEDLYLSATHHGDHDEFWIVYEVKGNEICRYSAKTAGQILWLDDPQQ